MALHHINKCIHNRVQQVKQFERKPENCKRNIAKCKKISRIRSLKKLQKLFLSLD